jgi:hypothetical protein
MFSNHAFTTIFFLDYGKNSVHRIDGYVYAYGLDNNWRAQQKLYLARVPNTSIQNRSTWRFFTGTDGSGNPSWSPNMIARRPVLKDDRLLYPKTFGKMCCPNEPVLGQGGVTYDAPLKRYIFASMDVRDPPALRGAATLGAVETVSVQGLRSPVGGG